MDNTSEEQLRKAAEEICVKLSSEDINSPFQVNPDVLITNHEKSVKARMHGILTNFKVMKGTVPYHTALEIMRRCNGWQEDVDLPILNDIWKSFGPFFIKEYNSLDEMGTALLEASAACVKVTPQHAKLIENAFRS
jgi:hypothetical protein